MYCVKAFHKNHVLDLAWNDTWGVGGGGELYIKKNLKNMHYTWNNNAKVNETNAFRKYRESWEYCAENKHERVNDLNINESCVCVGGACGTRQITGEKDSEDVRPCVCVRVFMHAYMNAIYAHTREYACMEEKKLLYAF